tara:strand:+ start:29393 stop:29779 length:387 start_codon:yes stop_codon:yes gene_type:complete
MIENLLEIKLGDRDNFLKIIETLSRIGMESSNNKLVQTCHVLHKRGQYFICHYRELFILDGYQRELTPDDIKRRNGIAKLLEQWNLCSVVEKEKLEPSSLSRVKVIPHKEKNKWTLKQNYTIGKNKSN